MLQRSIGKKYVGPLNEIAADFMDRIHEMRDANNELPRDFLKELYKWALECKYPRRCLVCPSVCASIQRTVLRNSTLVIFRLIPLSGQRAKSDTIRSIRFVCRAVVEEPLK